MLVEHRLRLDQLPRKIIRSIILDAHQANRPIPTCVIVGIRSHTIRYYRCA